MDLNPPEKWWKPVEKKVKPPTLIHVFRAKIDTWLEERDKMGETGWLLKCRTELTIEGLKTMHASAHCPTWAREILRMY